MKKNKIAAVIMALSLSLSAVPMAFADYQNISSSNIGQITSVNMIPTQAQYLVLDISKVKPEDLNGLDQELKKFEKYNGNISKFISTGALNKYNVSVSERGETQMSISQLNAYQEKRKTVVANFNKKTSSLEYTVNMLVDQREFSESGELGLGENAGKIGEGYAFLISYIRL